MMHGARLDDASKALELHPHRCEVAMESVLRIRQAGPKPVRAFCFLLEALRGGHIVVVVRGKAGFSSNPTMKKMLESSKCVLLQSSSALQCSRRSVGVKLISHGWKVKCRIQCQV